MKKTSLFCLALGLSAALCACGSAATETTPVPETDSAVVATESNDTTGTENAAAETESVVTEDAVPTSYLTGLECTEEEIEDYCKELPRYKRPKKIIFAEVPRNATGKIEKPALRKKYGADKLVEQQNRS